MNEDNRFIRVSIDDFNKQLELEDKKQKLFEEFYKASEAALNAIAMFQNYCGSSNIHLPDWLEKYNTDAFNVLSQAIYRVKEEKLVKGP